jgi:hypothetical protein
MGGKLSKVHCECSKLWYGNQATSGPGDTNLSASIGITFSMQYQSSHSNTLANFEFLQERIAHVVSILRTTYFACQRRSS